jgi:hypothetical protein
MRSNPLYYTILVVDIEGFGRRRNPIQKLLRERLYRILGRAMEAAGLDTAQALKPADRGDGVFWLLPTAISKVMLTGPFIGVLGAELRAHQRVAAREAHMRLRVALHAGEVSQDEHGWVGEDLNTACRLVDLQALRDALAAATGSPLALAVSDTWYHSTIRHRYPGIEDASFRPVPFRAKEVDQTAWITVPGYPRVPRHAGAAGAAGATNTGSATGTAGRAGRPGTEPGGVAEPGDTPEPGGRPLASSGPVVNRGRFAGSSIDARAVYGGDHYEGMGPGDR